MLIKKTVILAMLAVVLAVLLALWLVDKLAVLAGRDSEREFFARPPVPLEGGGRRLALEPVRRSA